jgi:phosphatidylserine decarboxylase
MIECKGRDKRFSMWLLHFVPKNLLSYMVGVIVHIPLPAPFSLWTMKVFVAHYNINMAEAEYPIEHYQSIGDLFTRRLKSGVRPIGSAEVVHPADATLTTCGVISSDTLLQAKGKSYKLSDFVGGADDLTMFEGGYFLTYYLCPMDYHRVHSPVEGEIVEAVHIPGRLWPVNEWSVANIDQLFSVNERVVVWIKTPKGLVALVMVGATNVGKMTMAFDQDLVTNEWPASDRAIHKVYAKPISVKKGEELGVFNMGSTVIMLYPKGLLPSLPQQEQLSTRMGENLQD